MKKKNISEILTTVLCTVFSTSKLLVKYERSRGYSLWYDGLEIFYDAKYHNSAYDLSDLTVFFIKRVQAIAATQFFYDIDYLPF